jgi:hypothetical protein
MTRTEALAILRESDHQGYVGWDDQLNEPHTHDGTVLLDGTFSKKELLALIVFFQDDLEATTNFASASSRKPL